MELTSRERMLRALTSKKTDYVPCSFMLFNALRSKFDNDYGFLEEQIRLGLDTVVYLPLVDRKIGQTTDFETLLGLPYEPSPEVQIKEWIDIRNAIGSYPILNKEYITPEGSLKMEVNKTPDWIFEDRLALLSDWNASRARKFLIQTRDDLKKLKYIMTPPTKSAIQDFKERSSEAKRFAKKHGLLVAGMWGVGMETAPWLTGIEQMILKTTDDQEFVEEFALFIEKWNKSRMEVFLDLGVDLFIRRGWYESVDFWSPKNFRKYLFPSLKNEAELCHQNDTLFAYILVRGSTPILDYVIEAGVDSLIGVDPVMDPYMNIDELVKKTKKRMNIWGGVNEALTLQIGSEDDIRNAIKKAINTFGTDGGFILSPVENILFTTDESWKKVLKFIEIWKEIRATA